MRTHISMRGAELTEDMRARTERVADSVAERRTGLSMAKFVLEQRGPLRTIGIVLAFGDGDTLVRHAQANDWDRAFLELDRKLERALEDEGS